MVKISIVIPLYNKEQYIKRALCSVYNQTVQDFEVIVIDDGSTDKGAQVVKNIHDARFRLISQENAGVSVARNIGIKESKSELIAFLDADDEWMPNYLETILRLREKYPYAGLYATSMKNEFIESMLVNIEEESRNLVPKEGLLLNYFKIYKKGHALFGASSVTIPREVFLYVGGFQAGFWWGEDVDMWGRIALKYPIAYNSQVCAIYYQNVANSAVERKKPVKIHPFVKTARETLELGQVPREFVNDLTEYIQFLEMFTAKHDIKTGDRDLALKLLARSDIKLAYKKKLLRIIVSTSIKNNFPNLAEFITIINSRQKKKS
ncbi:glycosyltransferase family 2 protein [Methanosarcina mazei]|uniref:glycosyltransferase family 2 protein n=1 Tax=Methanosarcina mazei TaxID=2209 RepID=UPI000696722F|nr:glycosyltransferase family A protein [Methanosarcina mazei]